MHPPFYVVDHRIDHDVLPVEERRVIRRSQPERLRFEPLPVPPLMVVGAAPPPPPVARPLAARVAALLARLRAPRAVLPR